MYAAHADPAAAAQATPAQFSRVPPTVPASSTTPAAAIAAQPRPAARRWRLPRSVPVTVTHSGPRNSMVTAMPSGMRANAW